MKLLFCSLVSIFFLLPVNGQGVPGLQEKLKQGVTADTLNEILEVGKSRDKAVIDYLITLASQPDSGSNINTVPSFAQIALARLGQEPYLSSIIRDVESENIFIQAQAIQKLGKVGGKPAFKEFYRILDDLEYRSEKVTAKDLALMREVGAVAMRKGDEILEPRSFLVMKLLSTIVENPPVAPDTTPTEKLIPIWKAWFANHKELIQ